MKTSLPPVLRAALYRRAVACAWLTLCERQRRYPHLTSTRWKAPSPPSWRASICASTARKKAV